VISVPRDGLPIGLSNPAPFESPNGRRSSARLGENRVDRQAPTPYISVMANLRITVWGNDPHKEVETESPWGGFSVPTGRRSPQDVEVIKINKKSMWVKLPDGSIIKRKRGRDY